MELTASATATDAATERGARSPRGVWAHYWPLVVLGLAAIVVSVVVHHWIYPAYSWNRDEPVYLWVVFPRRKARRSARRNPGRRRSARAFRVTDRELEILQLIADGLGNPWQTRAMLKLSVMAVLCGALASAGCSKLHRSGGGGSAGAPS